MQKIIISVGGSLVAPKPGKIATGFLKNLKHCLEKYFDKYQFFIFVGGGKVCRMYQQALDEFESNSENKDLMGIDITKINAKIIKQVFIENSFDNTASDPACKIGTEKSIIIGAGFKPGHSTDYNSVLSAISNQANTVINLTNIDFVHEQNPLKYPSARPLENISWDNFIKIVGTQWAPGYSSPFDPVASQLAQKSGIKVAIINGKHLKRLEDFLNGKKFIGTIIE